MDFLSELHSQTNKSARTENGALTNLSTLDPLLDFFSRAGAMRGNEEEAYMLFKKAYHADPTMAMRCLFYLRDIRGGQGERSVFRHILSTFDDGKIDAVKYWIPEYGRWDEVPISSVTSEFLYAQLRQDEESMKSGKSVSLLAKWLPSENASSSESAKSARELMKLWNLKPRQYRTRVTALRKYIKLLEQQMSQKEWAEIQYDKLPSQAHRKHTKAFKRHDETRYTEFIGAVNRGEKKINSNTLFAYEVYNKVKEDPDVADAMWKNLPDYTNGVNALVVADVSGSMYGNYGNSISPISVSVSLALYFAERNDGAFKDYFLTFSERSRLQKISGSTLSQRMTSIERADWGMSTNLQSAFDAILKAAQDSGASGDDIPKVLYIISDMEFNCVDNANETNFETARRKYEQAGFKLPHIVFWNVSARNQQSPATKFDKNVTLISGSNQSTFQYVVAGKSPLDSMLDILNSERYSQIKV